MSKETIKRSYNLKNLYLDPNNYRFVDNPDYIPVEDSQVIEERIQKRAIFFIERNKRDLAIFIKNENALNQMEETKSISQGLLASGEIDKLNYEKSLNDVEKGIEKLRSLFLDLIPKKSSLEISRANA